MTAKTLAVAIAIVLLVMTEFSPLAGAQPATSPSSRARDKAEPHFPPRMQIPDAIEKLKGKTVRILFDLDLDRDGTPTAVETDFLADLLKRAGVKVVRLTDLEIKHVAGQVLVLGDVEVAELSEIHDALEEFKHAKQLTLHDTYHERQKGLAQDATAAGEQVILAGDVAKFFGLDGAADAALAHYKIDTVREKLDLRVPQIKFDAVGLSDVMDYLRDVMAVPITVDWKALEAAGIDKAAPVTLRVRDVKLSKALQLILLSVEGETCKLGYAVRSSTLAISAADDLFDDSSTRAYDIRFLVPEGLESSARDKRIAALRKLLLGSIDPPSWGVHRFGKPCIVMELHGDLIVTQKEKNQNSVESLIKRMRELTSIAKP